ncbi:methionyl-tRNA formyltransferase [Fluviicola sp.]|uniref:methionyl-tRNA formyltransferase n=1 Tax=Fluviicola sp. TaxID=1917219 RepID=UPI003D282BC7
MENKKKILVLCGGKFALGALQKLAFEQYLCGIGIGKGQDSVLESVSQASSASGIPFKSFPTKQSASELREWIEEINPDYIFSISFPFLIDSETLEFGKNKFINFHPGPLPNFRGPMPIFEVLRYQEKQTAISVHFMSEQFDEGELILSDPLAIEPNETFGTLATKMSKHVAQVALNLANMLQFASKVPSLPQTENEARYFEFPTLEDTLVNWKNMSASEITSLINACNPWNNGADAYLNDQLVQLVCASYRNAAHTHVPGTILGITDEGHIEIACFNNSILLIEIIKSDLGILPAKKYAQITFPYIINPERTPNEQLN